MKSFLKENFLELYVTHLSANCADYAVCGWEPFDKKGLLRGGRKLDHLPPKVIDRNGAFHHAYGTGDWDGIKSNAFSYFLSNRCFSTESIKGERFDVSMPKGEDQDFLIRALLHVKKGVVISDIVYMYRMRASSLSHDNSLCVDDMELFVALMKKAKLYPESARTGLERRALDCWWQAIKLAMSTGTYKKNKARFVKAYNCLKEALQKPSLILRPRAFIYYTGQISVQTIVQGTFEELPQVARIPLRITEETSEAPSPLFARRSFPKAVLLGSIQHKQG